MHFVYIIYSKKLDRFYVGETYNLNQRLGYHNSTELNKSSTRKGIPWEMYLSFQVQNRSIARKIESHIKKMKSSTYKKNLRNYPEMVQGLIERYAPGSPR